MTNVGGVNVVIQLDNGEYIKGLMKTENASKESAKNIEGGFKGIGKALLGILSAGVVIDVIRKSIAESANAAKVQIVLENAIKKVGLQYKDLKKDIDEIANTNAVDDDDVKQMYAYAVSIGVPKQRLTEFVKTAYDFSAQSGKDITMAMRTISNEAIKGGSAWKNITDSVAGAGGAAADADGGLKRFDTSLKQLEENIGNALKPVLTNIITLFLKISTAAQNLPAPVIAATVATTGLTIALRVLGLTNPLGWLVTVTAGLYAYISALDAAKIKSQGFKLNNKDNTITIGTSSESVDNAKKSLEIAKKYYEIRQKQKSAMDPMTALNDEEVKFLYKVPSDIRNLIDKSGADALKQLSSKIKSAEKLKNNINNATTTGGKIDKDNLEVTKKELDLRKEIDTQITGLSEKLYNIVPAENDTLKAIKQQSDSWLGIANNINDINTKIQEYKKLQEEAGKSQAVLKLTTGDWLELLGAGITALLTVINLIFGGNKAQAQGLTAEERIDNLLKARKDLLAVIEDRMKEINSLEERQSLYGNKTKNDLEDALKLKQKELDIGKEKTDNLEGQALSLSDEIKNNEKYIALWEDYKKNAQKKTDLDLANHVLNDEYEKLAKNKAKLQEINTQITESDTEELKILKEIADLQYQISTTNDQNLINKLELTKQIAEEKGNTKDVVDMINQEISAYEDIISATEDAIGRSTSESEILDYQTTILEDQLKVEQLKKDVEEKITEEMKSQYDSMFKSGVLDKENLATIRSLSSLADKSGYSFSQKYELLSGYGITNASMGSASGKSINIGTVNNINNAASADAVAANMVNLISKKIGGIL
jgi:hypothetical protein